MSTLVILSSLIPNRSLPPLETNRESVLASSIGSWAFSAHEYSDDELVHVAALMLQHALDMPELEKWRISAGEEYFTDTSHSQCRDPKTDMFVLP